MSNQFRKTKVASYICLALASNAALAAEESTNTDDVEVIEVIGVRSSLTGAIAAKKSSDAISDSIIAEEIGKSSDENIAEALSRISGISLDRGSDAQTVTVRGIQASLNDIKLNGVSMTSSTDNQAVDLSLFSADILSRIDVVKSPSANQEEGSLGAAINLQTRAPLSSKKNINVFSVEGRYNDLSEETTPRFTYSFIQNVNESIGFSGSLFHDKQTVRKDEFTINSAETKSFTHDGDKTTILNAANNEIITDPINVVYNTAYVNRLSIDEKVKKGGTLTFQYMPNEDTDIRLDGSFSRQEIDHQQTQVKMNNFEKNNGNRKQVLHVSLADDKNSNNVVYAANNQIGGLIQPGEYSSTIDTSVFSANIDHIINDYWSVSSRLGYSATTQDYDNSTKMNWGPISTGPSGGGSDTWCNIDYTNGPEGDYLPEMNFCSAFDGANASTLKLNQFRTNLREVDDKKSSFYIDVERVFDDSFITSIEFGAKYTNRTKSVYDQEILLNKTHFENTTRIMADSVSDDNITGGRFLDGILPAGSPSSWVYPNIAEATAALFPSGFDQSLWVPDLDKVWKVDEITYGGYVQLNYEMLDGVIRGNFGVRYAKTDIEANSHSKIEFIEDLPFLSNPLPDETAALVNGNYTFPVYGENDYGEWLPSATVIWEINEDFYLRGSAARVLARTKIDDLRPGYTVRARKDSSAPTGNGGNTNLSPFLADQLDLSLEWYFGKGGMLAGALFYKDFTSYTYKKLTQDDNFSNPYAGTPGAPDCIVDRHALEPADVLTATSPCQVDFTQEVDGGNADIKGAELAYNHNYDFLPGFWGKFGHAINYTYADSEAIVDPDNLQDPFNGLPFLNTSKHSANITAYWENDFSSYRLAYSYRSRNLSQTTNKKSAIIQEARGTLDFSANFNLSKDLKLSLSAINLTNSYDKYINAVAVTTDVDGNAIPGIVREVGNDLEDVSDNRINAIRYYGRSYRLSLRYQF